MSSKYYFKGFLTGYERKNLSVNGNPCYWLRVENKKECIEGKTGSDSSAGYNCLNYPERERIIEYHYSRKGNLIIDRIQISGIDY